MWTKRMSNPALELDASALQAELLAFKAGRGAVSKRIMLVISGRIFRNGIELVLQGADRVIVGDCETLEQVEAALNAQPSPALHPDLFVIGITVPGRATEDFARVRALRAKLPAARWIVLSRSCGPEFWRDAVDSGIDGMLLEDSPGEVLQLLAELVLLGYSFLPTGLAKVLAEGLPQPWGGASSPAGAESELRPSDLIKLPDSPAVPGGEPAHRWHASLSERESDILRGLVAGHSNKLIARELQIAEATVKVHVKALLRKMQVTNRTQAAISALQFLRTPEGMVQPVRSVKLSPIGSNGDAGAEVASHARAIKPVTGRLSFLLSPTEQA